MNQFSFFLLVAVGCACCALASAILLASLEAIIPITGCAMVAYAIYQIAKAFR